MGHDAKWVPVIPSDGTRKGKEMKAKRSLSIFLIVALLCCSIGIPSALAETGDVITAGSLTASPSDGEIATRSDASSEEETDEDETVATGSDAEDINDLCEIELENDLEIEEELATASDAELEPMMLFAKSGFSLDDIEIAYKIDGTVIYEAEGFFEDESKIATCSNADEDEIVYVDMQPGDSITVPLDTYEVFEDGYYELAVKSNGNRTWFDIKVTDDSNATKTYTLTRTDNDFGYETLAQEADKLEGVELYLKSGYTIEIIAPEEAVRDEHNKLNKMYGWVDRIELTQIETAADMVTGNQLMAKDGNIAKFVGSTEQKTYDDRIELNAGESVEFNLSQSEYVAREGSGYYRVSVNMNGATRKILLKKRTGDSTEDINVGTIEKVKIDGYGNEDLHEFMYHDWVNLSTNDTLVVQEADEEEGAKWGHLEYVKLEKVLYEAVPIWLEAEDGSCADWTDSPESEVDDRKTPTIHTDGNRVELQRSNSITFTVPTDADSGIYTLFVSSNGSRTKLDVTVDDTSVGQVDCPGNGSWDAWDCEEKQMSERIILHGGSTITLTDPSDENGGGYGHVDYICLVKTGESSDVASAALYGVGLRKDDAEPSEKTSMRLRYIVTLPADAKLGTCAWNWGTMESLERYKEAINRVQESDGSYHMNLVVTNIPKGYYDTVLYTEFTAKYTLYGTEYTISNREAITKEYSVKEVANIIVENPQSESDKTYAEDILKAIDN